MVPGANGDEEDIQSEELVTARGGRVIRPWRNCNSPASDSEYLGQ